jgi:hypothetical protein
MILRTWHGCVPLKYAEGFAKHLDKTGMEHSRKVEGNTGRFEAFFPCHLLAGSGGGKGLRGSKISCGIDIH